MPLVSRSRSSPAQFVGEARAELQAPLPNALIGDGHTTLGQKKFDITEAQAEDVVEPHRVADQLCRKAVAMVRFGRLSHPAIVACLLPPTKPG
jgi:hypothetical protein